MERQKLRLALMLDAFSVTRWESEMLEEILDGEIVATHTINHVGRLTFIDAQRRRR